MKICTIGFSKKNLREFIGRLQKAGVRSVLDIRLNNTSQLAGYAKKDDLAFVLELVGIEYEHLVDLAPTQELMDDYKMKKISWEDYEARYLNLLHSRGVDKLKDYIAKKEPVCFLCAEDRPQHCHRRLAAEFFAGLVPGAEVKHL